MRLGLCCLFVEEPIRFRTTTAKALLALPPDERVPAVSRLVLLNADSLVAAVIAVDRLGIGAFRISSGLLPRATHPEVGYRLDDLPDSSAIRARLGEAGKIARANRIRLSFHPDQFVVLSSPRPDVVDRSLAEVELHAELAELVGAEMINLHVGGAYDDREAAVDRFAAAFDRLSPAARSRLTLENDDTTWGPAEVADLCARIGVPFVYDVHHHRCLPDRLDTDAATERCVAAWRGLDRPPHFHVSSPRAGWGAGNPRPHADFIDAADVPEAWLDLDCTVDVEAKAKELAVLRLTRDLAV